MRWNAFCCYSDSVRCLLCVFDSSPLPYIFYIFRKRNIVHYDWSNRIVIDVYQYYSRLPLQHNWTWYMNSTSWAGFFFVLSNFWLEKYMMLEVNSIYIVKIRILYRTKLNHYYIINLESRKCFTSAQFINMYGCIFLYFP